jgi:molybdate transport system substrate-binding protein
MSLRAKTSSILLAAVACFLVAASSIAAEVKVMISGGLQSPYEELGPEFEHATGHKLSTQKGPSMGTTPQAIPNRIDRGEPVDVVIMVRDALGELVKRGKVVASSRVDIANSKIAMAVKAGAPKPDIGTMEAFKRTVLEAKAIAYSDSASGVYLEKTLFPKMEIWEQIKDKSRAIPAEPVGKVVARGDASIGFQQLSELKAVGPGIDIVGLVPAEAQKVTTFSAGIATNAQQPAAAKALLDFFATERAKAVMVEAGLEPIGR